MQSLRAPSLAFFGLVCLAGCSSALNGNASGSASTNHAPPENTAPAVDALDDPTHPGISACATGDVDATLQMAKDYRESTHELVVCGGLATSWGSAIVNILLDAAIGGNSVNFTWDGATNTYVTGAGATGSPGTVMKVTAMLGADTSFGKKGDVIKWNLLDLSTYFQQVTVTAKASISTSGTSSTSLTATYMGAGPGVEILGLGQTPANPLVIDADKISANIGQILVKTSIHVDDQQGDSSFGYDVDVPTQTLSSALAGDPVGFTLNGTPTGTNMKTGQTLAITQWQINYLDTGHSGYMNGTIGFTIKGGAFPYGVTMHYPDRKAPDVSLACAN